MAVTPFKSSDKFNMAGFNKRINEVNDLCYDYLDEFGIPKIIEGCYIGDYGSADVINFIGYSMVYVDINNVANSGILYKSDGTPVLSTLAINQGEFVTLIYSGATTTGATVDQTGTIHIAAKELGESRYLFPFNLI